MKTTLLIAITILVASCGSDSKKKAVANCTKLDFTPERISYDSSATTDVYNLGINLQTGKVSLSDAKAGTCTTALSDSEIATLKGYTDGMEFCDATSDAAQVTLIFGGESRTKSVSNPLRGLI